MNDTTATDQFQSWLANMDDALDGFVAALPQHLQAHLDDSPGSLDKLEEWLLARYADVAELRSASQSATLDGAARYVGEVLRKQTASRWTIETRDPKFVFHGLPVLVGGKLGGMPACPLAMVTASLDRRTGHYLSSIAANFAA